MWPAEFQSDEWFVSGTYTDRMVSGTVQSVRKMSGTKHFIDIDGTTYQTPPKAQAGAAVSPGDWEGRRVTLCLDSEGLVIGVAYVYPDAVRPGASSARQSTRG